MSSNRRFVLCCLVQLSLCATFATAQTAPVPDKMPPDTVVARQGTVVLTMADIDAFAARIDERQRPGFFNSPKRIETLVQNLLAQRQLATEATKEGLEKDPSVQAQIRIANEEILSKARVDQLRASLKMPDFEQRAHEEYLGHAHSVYALLARGASSVQVTRFLHQVESVELQHPELATQDLTPLLTALRAIDLDA